MYHQAQERDEVCTKLWEYCKMGWPRKQLIPLNLTPYWKARNSLTICNDLLVYNSCIVLLRSMQRETLQKIHSGHLGIEKSRNVLQHRYGSQEWCTRSLNLCRIAEYVPKESRQGEEPLMTSELPKYPWQVMGTDLFELNKANYLLVVDYFSRYPEVLQLMSTTSLENTEW